MARDKIQLLKLEQLVREGNSVSEIARKLGVTKGAVSKKLKALNSAVTKDVALRSAGKIVDKRLDVMDQLQKINDHANWLLDVLMRWNKGEEEALQILEGQVRKVKVGRGEDAEEVTEYKFKDPRELALKAMQEIRGQLKIQLEIFQTLYDMQAVAEFQREVLEAIGGVSPEVRERIIRGLNERRLARSAVAFP